MTNEKITLANSTSWIKIYRKFLKWEWYDDINVKVLFLHCLLKANYKDKKWHGIEIKRGSFVTTIRGLAKETGLTPMQIRTALNKLKTTHEITQSSNTNYTVITINNYEKYQANNTQDNKPITHQQHTNNTPITHTIEYIEEINKNISKDMGMDTQVSVNTSLKGKEPKDNGMYNGNGLGMKYKPRTFGNESITRVQTVLKEKYPRPLEGITDRRKIHTLIQVLTKRKNQDEWMSDNWKTNFADFLNSYLESTPEQYLARSINSLKDKAKLWREYRGKLN